METTSNLRATKNVKTTSTLKKTSEIRRQTQIGRQFKQAKPNLTWQAKPEEAKPPNRIYQTKTYQNKLTKPNLAKPTNQTYRTKHIKLISLPKQTNYTKRFKSNRIKVHKLYWQI